MADTDQIKEEEVLRRMLNTPHEWRFARNAARKLPSVESERM